MLTDRQRAFLDEVHNAVVGTLNPDGTIQQTVIWYLRENDQIRFSLATSTVKLRNLRRSPAITLTVEHGQRYLTVVGRAAIETVDEGLRLRMAQRYVGTEQAAEWLRRRPNVERASIRVTIERVYGQGV